MRAHLADELDDVELVAGDAGVIRLAEIADLGDDAADLVMVINGAAHSLLGGVDTVFLVQLVHDLELELRLVVIEIGLVALHGRVDLRDEELLILHRVDEEEMLLHALHGRAAFRAEKGVEIVIPAFDGALEKGAGIGAGAVGHVIAGDIRGCAARRAEPGRKAAGKVEQNFRDVVAAVAQRIVSLLYRLCDKLVVCILKQILKIDQMLKVFHAIHLFTLF